MDPLGASSSSDDDGDDEKDIKRLLRQRAVLAAVKLLVQNGITQTDALDEILAREGDYFKYKIRRNIRRDKLQTVLKLFGFRSVKMTDPDDKAPARLDEVPERPEQRAESEVVRRYAAVETPARVLLFIAQAWYLIVVPFRCCYEVPRGVASVVCEGLLIDMIMYLTIVRRVFEPRDRNGVLRWSGVNYDYVCSWEFAFDIAANLPLDYLGLAVGSACTLRFNRCDILAPYWQLNRVLNVRKFVDNVQPLLEAAVQRLLLHPFIALVVMVGMVQTYCWHLFACFLFLDVLRLGCEFEVIDVGGTCIIADNVTLPLQYASALDWSSKVLAGWDRGSASPSDIGSFVFNFISVLFGCCVMTSYVAFVSEMVEKITPYIAQTMEVDSIMELCRYKRAPSELRDEMLADSWYRFDARVHMLQAAEVCGELPQELYDRLMHWEGLRVLSRVPLFAPLLQNERFVIEIARLLTPVVLAPTEILCEKGDAGDAMFFLVDGFLGVVDNDDWSIVKFTLKPGSFVGEIALLLGTSRTATVIVLHEFVRMLALNKKDFDVLRRRFPNTFAEVHQKARDRWMELNRPLLDQAKEIGKKEIAEIARRRWEQAMIRERLTLVGAGGGGGGAASGGRRKSQDAASSSSPSGGGAAPTGDVMGNVALLAVSKERTRKLSFMRHQPADEEDGGLGGTKKPSDTALAAATRFAGVGDAAHSEANVFEHGGAAAAAAAGGGGGGGGVSNFDSSAFFMASQNDGDPGQRHDHHHHHHHPSVQVEAHDAARNNIWAPRARPSNSYGGSRATANRGHHHRGQPGADPESFTDSPADVPTARRVNRLPDNIVGATPHGTALVADDTRGILTARHMSGGSTAFAAQFLRDAMIAQADQQHVLTPDLPPNMNGFLPRQQQRQQQSAFANDNDDGQLHLSPAASVRRQQHAADGGGGSAERSSNHSSSRRFQRSQMAPIVEFMPSPQRHSVSAAAGGRSAGGGGVDSLAGSSQSVFGQRMVSDDGTSAITNSNNASSVSVVGADGRLISFDRRTSESDTAAAATAAPPPPLFSNTVIVPQHQQETSHRARGMDDDDDDDDERNNNGAPHSQPAPDVPGSPSAAALQKEETAACAAGAEDDDGFGGAAGVKSEQQKG